ncbi:MAG: hypothetical protein E2P02_26525 [Acidobacteria bacterium]|nr:MAG: hypothetical protein E2P02_26525 [Acidobacteriota bacterium]
MAGRRRCGRTGCDERPARGPDDHGEEFLDHGGHWHDNVYGENTNVPLVLWAPGRIASGTVISEMVRSIDLMPTLLRARRNGSCSTT